MRPVIALVGRPNVGKSTLFNRVTKSRDALVADFPGLTRDRKYGTGVIGERDYLIIDTGGLSGDDAGIDEYMAKQTWMAVDEANIVLFLVDGKQGLTGADEMVAERLRRHGVSNVTVSPSNGATRSDVRVGCLRAYVFGSTSAKIRTSAVMRIVA